MQITKQVDAFNNALEELQKKYEIQGVFIGCSRSDGDGGSYAVVNSKTHITSREQAQAMLHAIKQADDEVFADLAEWEKNQKPDAEDEALNKEIVAMMDRFKTPLELLKAMREKDPQLEALKEKVLKKHNLI